jgi:hypothetical protein
VCATRHGEVEFVLGRGSEGGGHLGHGQGEDQCVKQDMGLWILSWGEGHRMGSPWTGADRRSVCTTRCGVVEIVFGRRSEGGGHLGQGQDGDQCVLQNMER